jgi:hypothetical protein
VKILPILDDRGTSCSRKSTGTFGGFSVQEIRCSGNKDDRISLISPSSLTFPGSSRKAYAINPSPKPPFRCRAQRVRRFPCDHIAEAVANVPTGFHERNRAAFHAQVLQRLDAPLLAFGELLFGEEDIAWMVRGIWTRRITASHNVHHFRFQRRVFTFSQVGAYGGR